MKLLFLFFVFVFGVFQTQGQKDTAKTYPRTFSQAEENAAKIRFTEGRASYIGTAVYLYDNYVATTHHGISEKEDVHITLEFPTDTVEGIIIMTNSHYDFSIIELCELPPHCKKIISTEMIIDTSYCEVFMLGFPSTLEDSLKREGNKSISYGKLSGIDAEYVYSSIQSSSGFSGSGVYNNSGLIALHIAEIPQSDENKVVLEKIGVDSSTRSMATSIKVIIDLIKLQESETIAEN